MIILLLILVVCLSSVSAYDLVSPSYSAHNFHTGLSGGEMVSVDYVSRVLLTFQQPGNMFMTSSSYRMNLGYFDVLGGVAEINYSIQTMLISPENGFVSNNISVGFSHLVNTSAVVDTCELNIDGVLNQSVSGIASNVAHDWNVVNLSEGSHNWNVYCNVTNGNSSLSSNRSLAIDLTNPIIAVNSPLNNTLETASSVNFNFNISELNPDTLIVSINGSNHTYSYSNGGFSEDITLSNGDYEWFVWLNDSAGHWAKSGVYNLEVNSNAIIITDVTFSPNPPMAGRSNTAMAKILGPLDIIHLRVMRNNESWINYTVVNNLANNYYEVLDGSSWEIGDLIQVEWIVTDINTHDHTSGIYNFTVVRNGPVNPGSVSKVAKHGYGDLKNGSLLVDPGQVYVWDNSGNLVEIINNGTVECEVSKVYIKDVISAFSLRDNLRVSKTEFMLGVNESQLIIISPVPMQRSRGDGLLIVESSNCGTHEILIKSDISYLSIILDSFQDVVDYVLGGNR